MFKILEDVHSFVLPRIHSFVFKDPWT